MPRGYPQSKGVVERNVSGVLGLYDSNGVLLRSMEDSGTPGTASIHREVLTIRKRCTIAEVNAGVTLLSAVPGQKIRMIGCKAIAIGGAVGAVTTIDVLGTQSSAVKLAAFAQASLTQSAVCEDGSAAGAVLADGASYVACDVNTGITVGKTGATATTATHVDVIFSYQLDKA